MIETDRNKTGIFMRVRDQIGRLAKDDRGVAAIEFAFVVPVLLALYFITMEVSQGLEANKKTSRVGIIVGDLITQQQTIVKAEVDAIMRVGEAVVQPYNRSSPGIYVTAIQITNESVPKVKVAWSRKLENGTASGYLSKDTTTTVPAALKVPGSFLVRTEVKLDYKPVLTWSASQKKTLGLAAAFDDIQMDEIYHLRPRMSQEIPCGDC
ncbi:TadE/TadG family type IV pilus assembly protein [Aquibium sp. LZ166]|uniref:TadE/TadG family type IV pilus assembly protein n=1 Tax=Aquibium pacificus TaxID=3153579 RepID=A0ABV3SFM6_9HYPH